MRLNYTRLLDKASFQSRTHIDEFGEYHSRHISINLKHKRKGALNPWEIEAFLRQTDDPSLQLYKAVESFAYFHELRHFHDFFGTMAGISLFTNLITLLKEFAAVVNQLHARKLKYVLPLADWARSDNCPDFVRVFIHKCQVTAAAEQIFQGNINLFVEPGFTDEIWRDIEVPELNLSAPAFPLAAKLVNTNRDEKVSIWRPLGLETLIEGNAQAMQRSYLEGFWPRSVVDSIWERMVKTDVLVNRENQDIDGLLSQSVLPYNTSDLLISKLRRTKGMSNPWPRHLLVRATDFALMSSGFYSNVIMSHPGRHFARAVQDADWTRSDPISPFSISTDILVSIRDSFEDIKSPHELMGTSSFDAIDVIESYVRREIICPLLNLRIRYGSEVFTELDEYLRRIEEFPKPIMTIYLDDFTTSETVDDLILGKWVEFCMLVTILEQLLNKATVISCPRAYSLVPGFSFFQMAKSGDCDQYVRNRECMVWSKGRLGDLPQCGFRNSIRLLGLEGP